MVRNRTLVAALAGAWPLHLVIFLASMTWSGHVQAKCDLSNKVAPAPSTASATANSHMAAIAEIQMEWARAHENEVTVDWLRERQQRVRVDDSAPCTIRFQLPLSSRIVLSFDGQGAASVGALTMETTGRRSDRVVAATSIDAGRGEVAYDLPAGDWRLTVPDRPAASVNARVVPFEISLATIAFTSKPWAISLGARETIRLDPLTRTTERRISLAHRSLVSLSVSGVPDVEKFGPVIRIDLIDAQGQKVVPADGEQDPHRSRASFIVMPGTYHVVVEAHSGESPSPPLEQPFQANDLLLGADAVSSAELSPVMQYLQAWIESVGLGGLLVRLPLESGVHSGLSGGCFLLRRQPALLKLHRAQVAQRRM
jgi:hypothetical protein